MRVLAGRLGKGYPGVAEEKGVVVCTQTGNIYISFILLILILRAPDVLSQRNNIMFLLRECRRGNVSGST
jgi:hypothetical protein